MLSDANWIKMYIFVKNKVLASKKESTEERTIYSLGRFNRDIEMLMTYKIIFHMYLFVKSSATATIKCEQI
jgi:hypothetical protein